MAGATAGTGCDGTQGSTPPVSACVKEYPREEMKAVASADAIRQAVSECQGDDGECRARTSCQGSAAGRSCQADAFITSDAALCVARDNGLEPSIGQLRASLVYDYAYRRVTWSVSNVTYDGARGNRPDAGGGDRGGQALTIDAVDARVLTRYEWTASP